MTRAAWLVPFFPLLGAALAAFGPKRLRTDAHLPVVAGIALAFLVSLLLLLAAGTEQTTTVMRWLTADSLEVPVEFRVDGLTTMMLSMVTLVSGLVAVFAAGYMAGDPAYPRFFALIGLFVFSMTGLVLSNNYLLTYVFWEGVGTCSYLLIGFWHARPSASAAAMKAFMVNRLGDFGFAVAILWMWSAVPNHDLSYSNVLSETTLALLPHSTIVAIALLLFWAATAKSCADSALRMASRRDGGPHASLGTDSRGDDGDGRRVFDRAVHADADARARCPALDFDHRLCDGPARGGDRRDPERSQARAGLLDRESARLHVHGAGAGVGGVGQLAVVAAMFHLFTHAFFKALLFLAAGSVMHAMGDVIDMRRFGGLRHKLPHTCRTFAVAVLRSRAYSPSRASSVKTRFCWRFRARPTRQARSTG